jgi:hypothetical protein
LLSQTAAVFVAVDFVVDAALVVIFVVIVVNHDDILYIHLLYTNSANTCMPWATCGKRSIEAL